MSQQGFTTKILHSDRLAGVEHGSLHKPIHTSVAHGYEKAEELAEVFQQKRKGFAYARQFNPTVAALENKITAMEGGAGTVCYATGMGAIGSAVFALLKAGDHIIASRYLFGNTVSLFRSFTDLAISVDFVDITNVDQIRAAMRKETRMVFCETIANPAVQVPDIAAIAQLCNERKIIFMLDNTITSPWLYQGASQGVSLSLHSLTKIISGHGDVLGGSVTDLGNFDWTSYPNITEGFKNTESRLWGLNLLRRRALRDFGASLSASSAHSIALGAETLTLRQERACQNAQRLAEQLSACKAVTRVLYPGLSSHPQHELAKRQYRHFGSLLSFGIGSADPLAFINRLKCCVSSTNLGDNRTLVIAVAHTIFYELGEAKRREMGIDESMIRVSVGIEDFNDLKNDFDQALS